MQDASDRFEIVSWDPRDLHLVVLENNVVNVVGDQRGRTRFL